MPQSIMIIYVDHAGVGYIDGMFVYVGRGKDIHDDQELGLTWKMYL